MELVQETLDLPVFTINFFPGDGDDQQDQQVGSCEFGRIDHSLYRGELVSVPVNNRTDGSWTIESVEVSVNGVSVVQSLLVGRFSSPKLCPFYIFPLLGPFLTPCKQADTGGANFMRVHPSIADAYWSQIQGSRRLKGRGKERYWGFPCDAPLRDFKLKFLSGGGEVVIPARFMNAGYLNDGAPKPREFCFPSSLLVNQLILGIQRFRLTKEH